MPKYKQRKDKRYYARVRTGQYNAEGSPVVLNLYGKTEKELEQKVNAARYERDHGLQCISPNMTFREYADEWLVTHKASKAIKTQEMYAGVIKNHTGLIGHKRIKDLKQTDIQRQINECMDHPRTAQQLRITIKQILDAAVLDNIVLRNVCIGIELPRLVKRERRAFTEPEKRAIRNAEYGIEERAFIMTLYCTGMRPAEVYALTWSDIDFKLCEIKVSKSLTFKGEAPVVNYPKTNAGIRTIQTPTMAIKALQELRRTNKHVTVFGDENGRYKTRSRYFTLFDHCKVKIEKELGYRTDITAYYFRHNYATMLYYSKVSMKEAIRLMGHSDHTMIMKIYSHLDQERENTREKLKSIAF